MQFPPTAEKARISEIFSSLQGEGVHVGERHIFIRFEECHIHCRYCDELGKPAMEWEIGRVMAEVKRLEKEEGPHTFVSLTGGEPLLYLRFVRPLMERLKREGFRVYLETDGILWPALEQVAGLCDCIAMDLKPSSVTGEKNFDTEHEEFLKTALSSGKETFIKIVLSKEIKISEFENQVNLVARLAPAMPVILQPISAEIEGHEDADLMKLLGELQTLASRKLSSVRIVPRLHRILNIR
ncbi:MAG TPA: 7-carboxy-7-deazaguanine synthase QueE [Verrucomicrobiae bacterium]|jgi:organic radical activating enzyme|nr:7-carboxy-7-deazaguanine synthase QueE [Verrucomicrobiae bacterium]